VGARRKATTKTEHNRTVKGTAKKKLKRELSARRIAEEKTAKAKAGSTKNLS